jgi:hypothetical protein
MPLESVRLSRFIKKALTTIDIILQFTPPPDEPDIIDFKQTKELFEQIINMT